MARTRPPSPQTRRLLAALAAEPTQWRHGYDLMTEIGVSSGSLYPILSRLADRGLLESSWDTPTEGRPPRHLYRLTAQGEREATLAAAEAPTATARRDARAAQTSRTGPAQSLGRVADVTGGA